jgi:nicotinate-nucleotide pyrophosphorylase (carboxylating)
MNRQQIVQQAIAEDLGAGDITTDAFLEFDRDATGLMRAQERCVVCGVDVVRETFAQIDQSLRVSVLVGDGRRAAEGETILTVTGRTTSILKGERVALNFIQRLSGIATMTATFADGLRHARVYDTRKTTPLLRVLEKEAVRVGGGANHRMGLYDAILIKDNHVELAGSISAALRAVRAARPGMAREVEVRGTSELEEALAEGAEIVLLDNMTPEQVRDCLDRIARSGRAPEVEVSGNITDKNIREYDLPGVTRISAGALTHSVKSVDINLKIERGA